MHCNPPYYHRAFCSCNQPTPYWVQEARRIAEHNAPFIRRAAQKRVTIKRAARLIAWARETYEE
jgi:hypothetical protein